jgi:hypothetical protein
LNYDVNKTLLTPTLTKEIRFYSSLSIIGLIVLDFLFNIIYIFIDNWSLAKQSYKSYRDKKNGIEKPKVSKAKKYSRGNSTIAGDSRVHLNL